MSILDTIKDSVLNNFSGSISTVDIILSLLTAFIIGMFIIYIYKKTFTGVVYSKAFALCILLLAMVTALIIRTISSNIALSLGMVGALSIVRFRTAVKEPVDTGFMFWAITAGIMAGASLYIPALVASLALGILYFVVYLFGFRTTSRYLLVVKYGKNIDNNVIELIKKELPKYKITSKTAHNSEFELTLEIDINKEDINSVNIVNSLEKMKNVKSASLIAYQNDFGN